MSEQIAEKIFEKLLEISKEQQEMKEEQQEMRRDFQIMAKKQDNMEEELTKIGNVVTKIEYEHGRKIDLILEILVGHEKKFVQYDARYEKDQKVIEMYGHRIYALEQKCES